MPWIARDKTGHNPYRLFGRQPDKLQMVDWYGDLCQDQFTWSLIHQNTTYRTSYVNTTTYPHLSNNESTVIDERDCPCHLEPGEGPVEVNLSLVRPVQQTFEGVGI
jgi:hypothetical protein